MLLGPASGSDLTFTSEWRLKILTLSVRAEGADKRVLVGSFVSKVDLGRLDEFFHLAAWEMDLESSLGTAEAQLFIAT